MAADIVTHVVVDTSQALSATLKYSQSLEKLQATQTRAAAAQAKLDEALAASGAGSDKAIAAQAKLEAALRRTATAEAQVGIAAARSAEVQAAAADKAAAAQTAASAKQAAAVKKIGTGFGIVGTAAALGLGLAAKAASDFNAKMAVVASLSHASAEQVQKLASAAGDYANLGISASQAADAEIELTKAGLSASQILGGALHASLLIAADGQINVGTATQIAASAMVQFKLKASDMGHVADLLAAGADKALGSVQDLGEGLQYAGLGAHQAGLSIDQTVGALAEFAQAGLIGSQGGTTLQQVLRQLLSPTQKAAAEIQTLGLHLYDAKGNFVGLASVAGQLRDKLGGMTEANRNAALGTLFTSRAVRGATILYQDGAAGVNSWVQKVNDSGFAAQQAQGKMNSLSGDMEKLKAQFENDAISIGQQLQPALRTLTQTTTDFLKVIGDVPDPVKAVGVETLAVVAALGLGVFAFTRIKAAAVSFGETLGVVTAEEGAAGDAGLLMSAKTTLAANKMLALRGGALVAGLALGQLASHLGKTNEALGVTGSIASDALIGFAVGGPIGAALGAGAGAMLNLAHANAAINDELSKTKEIIAANPFNFAAQIDAAATATANLNKQSNGYFAAAQGIVTQVPIIGSVLGFFSDKAASAAKETTNLGASAAISKVNFAEFLQTLNGGTFKQAFGSIGTEAPLVAASLKSLGWSAGQIKALFKSGIGAQQAAADLKALDGAAGGMGQALTDAGETGAQALGVLTKAADAAYAAIFKLDNHALTARANWSAYKAAIDDASAALKQNGRTLDQNTAAGRANNAALDNIAKTAITIASSMKDPALRLNFLEQSRAQLIKTAQSFGDTHAQAVAYTNSVLAIPKQALTLANFEANAALNTVAGYKKAIDSVPGFKNTVVTASTQEAEAALSRLAGLEGEIYSKNVAINVNTNFTHSGVQAGMAGGGIVGGVGTGTSDSNLVALSRGEAVTRQAIVNQQTPARFAMLNAGQADIVPRQYLARGGSVGSSLPSRGWSSNGAPTYSPTIVVQSPSGPFKVTFDLGNGKTLTGMMEATAHNAVRSRALYNATDARSRQ